MSDPLCSDIINELCTAELDDTLNAHSGVCMQAQATAVMHYATVQ